MIRTNPHSTPKRRIAVIAIPRPQQTRLGVIRNGDPASYGPPVAWTTISAEGPESSSNFLTSVMARQQLATLNTPGTLTYTPAPTAPVENVAPWNSWLQPNCPPPATPEQAAAAAAASGVVPGAPLDLFWVAVGLATSAAAIAYLARGKKGK
jgi:hypothetical protein